MNRQKLVLFVLAILLVLSAVWAYMKWPREKTVASSKSVVQQPRSAPEKSAAPAPARIEDERVLRLDLLDRQAQHFSGYRRDIFKPVFVDEIKMMKHKAAAPRPMLPPVQPTKTIPTPAGPPPVALPEVSQRELARFTFLGFLKKDNRKTIFLSKDKDIILVKKGDIFAHRYEASSITDQALTITVTDTGEEIVIPLIENQPLVSAAK